MTTSILAGSRLVWLMNKANWRVVTEQVRLLDLSFLRWPLLIPCSIRQAPPVGTMWVFAIVQMPVGRAVITLLAVFLWGWHSNMRLFPS